MREDALLNKVLRALSGTAAFVLVYIIVISLYQLVVGGLSIYLDYHPHITFNALLNLPIDPQWWGRMRILFVFGGGAMWLLLQGIVAFGVVYIWLNQKANLTRYLLLWYGLLSFNFLFMQIATCMSGSVDMKWGLYQGLAMVVAWWRIPVFFTVPVAIMAAIVSAVMGYMLAPTFLTFIYSSKLGAKDWGRRQFLFTIYLLPVIAGALILFPLLTPYSISLHLMILLNLVLVSFGIFLRAQYLQLGVKAHRQDVLKTSPLFLLPVCALAWTGVYFWFR